MTATAQPQIQLQPLEWAIVAALRERGSLTTSAIRDELAQRGETASYDSVRARLATLTRFCILVREEGATQGKNGSWESRYRLRVQ